MNEAEREEDQLEELDVEQFAQGHAADCRKPDARVYIIRVDRETKRVREQELTGAKILELVGKGAETHKLFQKFRGGRTEAVQPNETVSFVAPGVERFQTIPRDTCEGSSHG